MPGSDLTLETEAPRRPGSDPGRPGFFSSARAFTPEVGPRVSQGELGGYYIDFRLKQKPPMFGKPGRELHVATAQWGLGGYERHLAGEGDEGLATALEAAKHLVELQVRGGAAEGGWIHDQPMAHTYKLDPPWMSAMAQGEGASLLLRVHAATGEDRFAEAALKALRLLSVSTGAGGLRIPLGSGFFLEEYPTEPPSMVLNGGIFALWGYRDAAVALGDAEAEREFETGVDSLAANIMRWDTGGWTRYDLFPHPVTNIASSFYHLLHINQLRAMQVIAPRPELGAAVQRWDRYRRSRLLRATAFARKATFRLLVPRSPYLAHRLPFGRTSRAS
jgi:heparosan-N-sulfate-glucuronate 5-epimerase